MAERRNIFIHDTAEGIPVIYKTRKISFDVGRWDMSVICNGCYKKDFLSTKIESWRTVSLIVREFDEKNEILTTYYCSGCAVEALNEINREVKKLVSNAELDKDKIEQEINRRKKQSATGD